VYLNDSAGEAVVGSNWVFDEIEVKVRFNASLRKEKLGSQEERVHG
jgi:hypothetical protein